MILEHVASGRQAGVRHRQVVDTAVGSISSLLRQLDCGSTRQRVVLAEAARDALAAILRKDNSLRNDCFETVVDYAESRMNNAIAKAFPGGIESAVKDLILDSVRRHARGAARTASRS